MEAADFNQPLLFTELAEAMGELEPGNVGELEVCL